MKLLYLANLRLPTQKAYGIQVTKTCEAFAKQGNSVTLVFPYRINPDIGDDVFKYYEISTKFNILRIWAPDFRFFYYLGTPAVLLKNLVSSLLLVWQATLRDTDFIYSRDELPLFFLSFFKKNLVFEAHKFSGIRKLFFRRFLRAGVLIITISHGLKEDFISIGFKSERVLVAPDGVDLEKFDSDITKSEARKKIGLPDYAKIALYAGHLFPWKGVDTLALTARLIPDVTIVFIGGMKADIAEFRKKYSGVENIVIAGYKPHREIPQYLKAADVLVLPNSGKEKISSHHTSPVKLFEYMASGRPIVASELPSISEVLSKESAFLVPPDNPEKMAEAIKLAIADTAKAAMAFRAVHNYTWQNRAVKILNFIQSSYNM